jgi:Kef-type K+ transport system membrane component KefB
VRVATLVQAGAGLGSVLAIVSSDLISFSPEGSRALIATLLVAAAAGSSLRAVLGSQVGSDGRLTLALLATLSLVAGAAAAMDATPLPGAFLLGMIVTNTQGGSMRRMERLVSESEPAVAAIFFLLAGVLLEGASAWWPWLVAGGVLLMRVAVKPVIASVALRAAWKEPGAGRLRSAAVRQAPIAIALGVAALQAHDGSAERGILLALTAVGLASGVLPLLWRSRA